MGGIPIPRDNRGNELFVGCECVVHPKMPFVFKLVVVESGGIETPQGKTLAHVRAVCDLSLHQIPGVPFDSIVRIVSPTEQQIAEAMASRIKI